MHNLNGTMPREAFEADDDGELELEFEADLGGDTDATFGELEFEGYPDLGEADHTPRPFDEATELELAAELLEVGDDEELEQFLGKLFRRAVKGIRRFARSSIGRRLGSVLKKVAKKALPIAGGAVGGFFGGPAGSAIGGRLGSWASRLFELELEGLSPEDQELEVARRFVRLAGTAAQAAAHQSQTTDPATATERGLSIAARAHAPGLLPALRGRGGIARRAQAGRWIRRRGAIIVLGA